LNKYNSKVATPGKQIIALNHRFWYYQIRSFVLGHVFGNKNKGLSQITTIIELIFTQVISFVKPILLN
jgi:hypothetical protein